MELIDSFRWRKSSYSGNGGANCVEVARSLTDSVAVRDSKNPEGPKLAFSPGQWRAFTDQVKDGKHNLT